MFHISELRQKDIVNILDGKKLGPVRDIEVDLEAGIIKALVLPGNNRFRSFFFRNEDIIVHWHQIKKIGVDVVLVELSEDNIPTKKDNAENESKWLEYNI